MKKFNISKFDPCKKGLEYYNSQHDFETAWNNCERGDWMLWIAKKMQVDDRKLTLAKAHCANTVRHLMKDKRIIDSIDAAMKYGNGEISRVELNIYASSASAAVSAAVSIASASYAASAAVSAAVSIAVASAAAFAASADDSVATSDANTAYADCAAAYASAADYAASAAAYSAASFASYAADYVSYAASFADAKEENQKQTADICKEYLTEEVFNKIK